MKGITLYCKEIQNMRSPVGRIHSVPIESNVKLIQKYCYDYNLNKICSVKLSVEHSKSAIC